MPSKCADSAQRGNHPTAGFRLIATVHQRLSDLGKTPSATAPAVEKLTPTVPIRRSVQPDYVVCLECGFRGKTLRRHLRTHHGLEVAGYRARWKLPTDEPQLGGMKTGSYHQDRAPGVGSVRRPSPGSAAMGDTRRKPPSKRLPAYRRVGPIRTFKRSTREPMVLFPSGLVMCFPRRRFAENTRAEPVPQPAAASPPAIAIGLCRRCARRPRCRPGSRAFQI